MPEKLYAKGQDTLLTLVELLSSGEGSQLGYRSSHRDVSYKG